MSNNWIQAGPLRRGQLRRALVKEGVIFTETKSFAFSVFVIPDNRVYAAVIQSLREQGVL